MNSQKPIGKCENKKCASTSRNKQTSKRIILIMFIAVIAIVVVCLAMVGAIEHYNKPEQNRGGTLIFHEADYDYDIMNDSAYLNLDRNIYFENTENGIKSAIVDGNLEDVPTEQHKHVSLLCDFINYAIAGDDAALNSLFSDEYIEADGKTKMDFTMQQLYNIKITYIQKLSEEVDGNTYVSYDYWLEYMIRKNNGTFRNDMESDCIKKEYVRVTDRAGDIGIDVLAPYNTQTQTGSSIDLDKIIIISAVSVALIAVVGVGLYLIAKKRK